MIELLLVVIAGTTLGAVYALTLPLWRYFERML